MRSLIAVLALSGCIESNLKEKQDLVGEDTASPDTPSDDTGQGPNDDTGVDTGEPPPVDITAELRAPDGVVLDPKLSGDPTLGFDIVTDEEACTLTVAIDNGIGQQVILDAEGAQWDGRDAEGLWFEPGPARAQAMADCGSEPESLDALRLHIVRLGLQSIDLHSAADDDSEVELAFHKSGLSSAEVSPIGERPEYLLSAGAGAALGGVDDDVGLPRTIERWTHPDSPPWSLSEADGHNVPAGYVAGGQVLASVTLGAQAVSQSRHISVDAFGPSPAEVPTLRVVGTESALSPGGTVTVDLAAAQETMGREVRTVTWQFESVDADGEVIPIPGHFETTHTLYTLAGTPALLDGTSVGAAPPVPWIGVLDDTAEALEGVEAAPGPVLDALRDYLFEHPYIIYNPGDSAYTSFTGAYMYWSSITADLSGFLDRTGGLDLYCHSMSCLLSALAGNVGVEAPQVVLGVYFTTNQTRAAGGDSWRRWSFNSHSVVTPDGGETIWDSSIALDGDEDPYNEPIEEVMPRGMSGEEYFWRLTYDDIEIINSGLCYIQ